MVLFPTPFYHLFPIPTPSNVAIRRFNIIIAPLSILSADEWGDLKRLYKARQAAETDGGLFTYTGVHERGENERHMKMTVK